MAGNVVVTTTRNDVVFSVDNKSFNDAKKKINSLKSEWEKTTSAPRSTRERAARPKVVSASTQPPRPRPPKSGKRQQRQLKRRQQPPRLKHWPSANKIESWLNSNV